MGDTVVWRNTGSLQHTVTSEDGAFDSGLMDAGAVFEHTFDSAGAYNYRCTPHPWMKATVRVADPTVGEPVAKSVAGPGEQAAGPSEKTVRSGRVAVPSRANDRPVPILLSALLIAAAVIALTVLLAGLPWHQPAGAGESAPES